MTGPSFDDRHAAETGGEPDGLEWEAEQRQLVEEAIGRGAYEDLCLRRTDPAEEAFWGDDGELDFED